jgi:hypothetical protein
MLSGVSLLLFVAVVVMWVRGQSVADHLWHAGALSPDRSSRMWQSDWGSRAALPLRWIWKVYHRQR